MLRTSNHARHPGLTLLEAMIAMGIAAIGMLALLVLFPLGALQMGQALKDERTSQCALQADGLVRTAWRGYAEGTATDATLFNGFDNPGGAAAPQITGGPQPSYPVFVDPIGYYSQVGLPRNRVAGLDYLPRRNFAFIASLSGAATPNAVRFCTLLDDMTFEDTGSGKPYKSASGQIERQGRYNWLAVLQRPNYLLPMQTKCTVVVFDGRAPGYAPTTSELAIPSTTYPQFVNSGTNVILNPGLTSLTLYYQTTGTRPAITKGRWLMDATSTGQEAMNLPQDGTNPGSVAPTGPPVTLRHANFYRVASVNDETPGRLEIELEKPIVRSDGGTNRYAGTVVLLAGTAEVFDRPMLTDR